MSDFEIKRPSDSRKRKRVVGRGASARRGGTAGRGDKGQNARSGGGVAPGFEGGQMPLYRRIAIRGFNNKRFTTKYDVINVCDLVGRYVDGDVVNLETLVEKKLVKKSAKRVKLLGNGDIDFKVTVDVDAISESASKKITAAGGSVASSEKV